jgi:hypothetical protein
MKNKVKAFTTTINLYRKKLKNREDGKIAHVHG